MKTTIGLSLLGAVLISGCSMAGPSQLAVHEALLYGSSQQRVVWVYGTLQGPSSSLKLGGSAVTLRPQQGGDPLALSGTLSVDGKAIYSGSTTPSASRVNVARTAAGGFTVSASGSVDAVYYVDGSGWTRLSGPLSAGQTVSGQGQGATFLRGAGSLTDPEADALGRQLQSQGPLVVAVLPVASLPDAPIAVEPAPAAGMQLATGLYVQAGAVPTSASSTDVGGLVNPTLPGSGAGSTGGGVNGTGNVQGGTGQGVTGQLLGGVARQIAGGSNAASDSAQVLVARDAGGLATIWNTGYGRQSPIPTPPALSGGGVVGVFLGRQPTGGYALTLSGASLSGGVLTLRMDVRRPGPGSITTQALTSPWVAVQVLSPFTSVQVLDSATGQPLN